METSTKRLPLFERLQVESQSNCNRSCWFCPRTYDRSGRYLSQDGDPVLRQMPTETILDLLDQARDLGFRGRVGFHHYSEPLLDRRNIHLAWAARDRGMEPYLHTNGDALRKSDRLCSQVLEVYRIIVVGLYDYRSNEELEEAKDYWRQRLAGVDPDFSPIGTQGVRSGHSIGVPRAMVPSDDRMAVPDLTFLNGPCHRPLIRLVIQYDGQMCNCCEDLHGAFCLGNILESSIEELWWSERHVRIVEDLVRGRRERYRLCRSCPMPPTGRPPDGESLKIDVRRQVPDVRPKVEA